jgi:transcriptional regulator with XRE-family HTH domain
LRYYRRIMPAPSSTLSVAIGYAIRRRREHARRSVDWLAKKSGVDARVVAAIEIGSRQPSIEHLDRLAVALGTTAVALVKNARKTPESSVPVNERLEKIARVVVGDLPDGMGDKLDAVERAIVRHAMSITRGNKSAAARLLGVERKALVRRWDKIRRADKRERAA